jgi:colanic acid/amylovoran biosynthesis glycosyltransferase
VRVCVLTTSYPRWEGDAAGAFVAEQVEHLRANGVDVTVVSPQDFPHFGIAYGDGIAQNLRTAPWKAALVPGFLAAYAAAARRAARDADVVHAHWLPSGLAALATGKPCVLQVWGTDVELARRARALFRPVVRRARVVLAASTFLAAAAGELGARDIRVIPNGVEIPERVSDPADPPHVLFVGRLSEEKGILEFLAATEGLARVIVGDGPLRDRVPDAVGFVPHHELADYYARAAVVCVPSRREGYGVVAREAMAYGRPVVATRVGGLVDAIEDGVTGRLVEPEALRSVIAGLLADRAARVALGAAAAHKAREALSWPEQVRALREAYASAERVEEPVGRHDE